MTLTPRFLLTSCLIGALWLPGAMGVSVSGMSPAGFPAVSPLVSADLPFIENQGQVDEAVRYYLRLPSGTLFVTDTGELVYALRGPRAGGASGPESAGGWALKEVFLGGNPARPQGAQRVDIPISHFTGPDPEQWYRGLPSYRQVDLGELFPGIRVALLARGRNVEKVLRVAPGADPRRIRIAVEGVHGLAVDAEGRLVLHTGLGAVFFTAPVAYQQIEGRRESVEVAYTLGDDGYGFTLGEYRPDLEVVIDPLISSTFVGGMNPSPPGNYDDDIVNAMVHAGDSIYLAGATQSPDFPIVMGYDETLASNFPDCFVTRMSTDLSTVLASTFLGTESSDQVRAMALDGDEVVIVGKAGWGFPVTDGAYTYNGSNMAGGGFVSRLSADLSTLVASAIVTPNDHPRAMALGNGSIYFGGSTNNPDLPITPGAYRSACCPPGSFGIRPYEGFAGRISSDLSTLEAMTYLGGHAVAGVAVGHDGSVFIADAAESTARGYLARFDADLTDRRAYLSYNRGSNGSSRTYFNAVEIVGSDSVVSAGQTYIDNLPATEGAYDQDCGTDGACDAEGPALVPHSDGFVAVYSYDLSVTRALTYLGGSNDESIRSLALGGDGSIVVAGETISADFPTTANGGDASCGTDGQCNAGATPGSRKADAFLATLSADLSMLEFGSYLGGSDEEQAYAVVLDPAGEGYVGGYTRSADFPTTSGAFDQTYNGGTSDAFVSRFGEVLPAGAPANPGESCGNGMPLLKVTGYDPDTSMLTVSYSAACNAVDHNIYYGPLREVANYAYTGESCSVGMSGEASFSGLAESFFFVIAADDGMVEGSYGTDSSQAERPDAGSCGFVQDLSEACSWP
ncbi:MAG: hypothetical protein Q9Q13_04105 [Acidobacteriota bacterium]|nr:hypothetical protein [Acidobacteriota bacterium]